MRGTYIVPDSTESTQTHNTLGSLGHEFLFPMLARESPSLPVTGDLHSRFSWAIVTSGWPWSSMFSPFAHHFPPGIRIGVQAAVRQRSVPPRLTLAGGPQHAGFCLQRREADPGKTQELLLLRDQAPSPVPLSHSSLGHGACPIAMSWPSMLPICEMTQSVDRSVVLSHHSTGGTISR